MNVNTYCHKFLKPILNKEMICIDATIGNGNDTLFLCQNTKFVYGFDIQKEAITNTTKRLKNLNNYKLYEDNFINQDKYIKKCNLIIYNLGYLPNHDKKIKTNHIDFEKAFKKSLQILEDEGYIIVTFYFHKQGFYEYYTFLKMLKEFKELKIIGKYCESKYLSPKLYILKK